MSDYIAVLPVKDGEEHIEESVLSLLSQTHLPRRVYIIDDGSHDTTPQILQRMSQEAHGKIEVIRHESSGKDFQRIPLLYNLALKEVPQTKRPDFILFTSDDAVYQRTYMEQLLSEFNKDERLVVASGDFEEKQPFERAPQGTGRLISYPYYASVGGYPEELWGWESWILFKALMDDRKIKCFPDIRFQHVRPYSNASIKTFGYAMYCLGYSPLMVLSRFGINFLRRYITFKQNWIMLYGWVSAHWKHFSKADEEFRRQLRKKQHTRIKTILLRIIYKPFKSKKRPEKDKYAWC